jgi:outer membrane protein assembly factor BamB
LFFTLLTAIILFLNYLQISSNNPLENETKSFLLEVIEQQENNENLRQEYRAFDLMARKAFFTKQWQIKFASYLLLGLFIILIISLKLYFSEKNEFKKPSDNKSDSNIERFISQKWILISTSIILILALYSAFYSNKNNYDKKLTQFQESINKDSFENVEKIELQEAAELDNGSVLNTDTLNQDSTEIDSSLIQADKEKKIQKPRYPDISAIKKNFHAFRGAFSQGYVYSKNIPTDWDISSGRNVLWKTPIPQKGYNSPIIWADRLYFAGGDEKSRNVFCYNRHTGKLIWKKSVDNIDGSPEKAPKTTDDTGLSAPTMTTDGQRVYAIFGTGDIISFDMDGNRVWARNLGVPDNHYGHSSSLLCYKNKLIVQYDTKKSGRLLILDVESGSTLNDIPRNVQVSWASPILAEVNSKLQIILASNPNVIGYDFETVNELWSVKCLMGEVGPSPAFYKNTVFAVNEYAKLVAINPVSGSIKWESMEYMAEVSAPVAANDLLFIATSYGVLACYNVNDGSLVWEHDFDDGFYSTPMAVGKNIYIIDLGGNCHIIEASNEFKLINSIPTNEKVFATPAFADGRIYIKGEDNLYCIGK